SGISGNGRTAADRSLGLSRFLLQARDQRLADLAGHAHSVVLLVFAERAVGAAGVVAEALQAPLHEADRVARIRVERRTRRGGLLRRVLSGRLPLRVFGRRSLDIARLSQQIGVSLADQLGVVLLLLAEPRLPGA